MRRAILAIVATLSWNPYVCSEVIIAKEHRIPNRSPGYCCWCCLETLGRQQKITALYELTKARDRDPDFIETQWWATPWGYQQQQTVIPRNLGTEASIRDKLDTLGVHYHISHWDYQHLHEAVRTNGCLVLLRPNALMPGSHAVILTDLTDEKFVYLDPNGCDYWQGSTRWFAYYWTGIAISVEK